MKCLWRGIRLGKLAYNRNAFTNVMESVNYS